MAFYRVEIKDDNGEIRQELVRTDEENTNVQAVLKDESIARYKPEQILTVKHLWEKDGLRDLMDYASGLFCEINELVSIGQKLTDLPPKEYSQVKETDLNQIFFIGLKLEGNVEELKEIVESMFCLLDEKIEIQGS